MSTETEERLAWAEFLVEHLEGSMTLAEERLALQKKQYERLRERYRQLYTIICFSFCTTLILTAALIYLVWAYVL